MTVTETTSGAGSNPLGAYLRDRRARLDPVAFGFSSERRRTPGLRREEVAQRANVSATWYTWLEQGRGGAPSADVLDRISRALELSTVEREHLFLLAQHRLPEVHYEPSDIVTPTLQRVLDSMEFSAAVVRNATWDIVAWNRAALAVLGDYPNIAPDDRNVLRILFCRPNVRAKMPDWENDARFAVAAFRADITRSGASERAQTLIDELCRISPDFAAMWHDNDVSSYGEGKKHVNHPIVGPFTMSYSTFSVDGQPNLGMVVYTPETAADAERMKALIAAKSQD
ncbi:helix-turn-helix transcriptional regulator [Tardiphaga sp. 1201_B9_N1_1]|jgi:transcriptional regulator with XRE-family HTH domain|uniref:helix-turn-helix transcriptional regulator n=1 Tax=unclassified Tardiphaga TaxID=2631404 RepID=UPI000E75A839